MVQALPAESDRITLRECAQELGILVRQLMKMAAAGEFPAVFQVTNKNRLLSRSAYETWKSQRWTSPACAAKPRTRRRAPVAKGAG